MYRISKEFAFCASHVLNGLHPDHPCSRLHGHNYRIELVLEADDLDSVGFIYDYRQMDGVKKWVDEVLDHRHLNDVVKFNPTAEMLAEWIYGMVVGHGVPHLAAVNVSETPKTWASYRP